MKLSEVIKYINTALNYPAVTYLDINIFFDMAISELNTTLHTSIPLVKDMVETFRHEATKSESNKVLLANDPADTNYVIPTDPVNPLENEVLCYYSTETRKFYILNKFTNEYLEFNIIKAVFNTSEGIHLYQSINYGSGAAWAEIPTDPSYEADLDKFLPDDWIMLWLIPYICFKYTVRDGGTAQTFAEELTQGFQQLQETYDIPSKVLLATCADKPAYTELVEEHLPNLNIWVPTRAIYESMKHPRNMNAIFGGFYDRGGF
jgi:hypothetical protein